MTQVKTLVLVTGLQGTGKSTVADIAGTVLSAPVLAHDWAMSGLRPYAKVQAALDAMDPPGHRAVGWSLLHALARSQMRRGCSVVLDGVARSPEVDRCRHLAAEEGARFALIVTQCSDLNLHRARIENRQRDIPDWYEIDWRHVEATRTTWAVLTGVDLVVDATVPLDQNAFSVRALLHPS